MAAPVLRSGHAVNSGTWAKVCVKLAADPAIDADSNDTALHESQRKAVRNAKRCPSRTSVGSKRRRCSGHGSQTATRRGALFTPEVRQATLALLPTLRRAGVVRQPVRPDGPLIRALAASLHMDIEGMEREDAQALMHAYGAATRFMNDVQSRIHKANGVPAILAAAAVAVPTQAHALGVLSRGGPRLRSAGLPVAADADARGGPGGEGAEGASSSSSTPCPLRLPVVPPGLSVCAPPASAAGAASLPPAQAPGGEQHCGGDLVFPHLALLDHGGRMPLFVMAPGATAIFDGSREAHGTTAHDAPADRPVGSKAHVSFAVQTPAQTLGLARHSPACEAIHRRVQAASADDARSHWADAAWLPVYRAGAERPPPPVPEVRLEYDAHLMEALQHRRVVLYDAGDGHPLVLYDYAGGLGAPERQLARQAFAFLDGYQFTLSRQRESRAMGALGIDGVGGQRMLMLGVRQQKYGCPRPDGTRRGHTPVANSSGDLDAYVAHWDVEAVRGASVRPTWDAIEACMRRMLPTACEVLGDALEKAGVRDRLYTKAAHSCMSVGLLVNNVGASESYQSPGHLDHNDVGMTCAVAVK